MAVPLRLPVPGLWKVWERKKGAMIHRRTVRMPSVARTTGLRGMVG